MRFFEKFFDGQGDYVEATGQLHVVCPFPHKNSDGTYYKESNASAHVDVSKGVFHCKNPSCHSKHTPYTGVKGGLSESGFMAAIQGMTYGEAVRVLKTMEGQQNETEQWDKWHQTLVQNDDAQVNVQLIGLEDMIEPLKLGFKGRGIVFPIFIYGEYMGSCDYHPYPEEGQKKATLEKGTGQAIFPFDLWREDERDTFLCAGFKDAAMGRKHGLNAITFTHGEGSFPKLYKRSFTGRKVFICYDNDEGGREGARKTAALLKEVDATPVIVDLSSVCTGEGEDIHDFFHKYEKTAEDLKELAYNSPLFTDEEYEDQRNEIYPLVSLAESTSGKAVGRILSSRVAVVAEFNDWTARIPEVVEFEKIGDGDYMNDGDTVLWTLEESNIQDVLYLMDNNLTEAQIDKNLKKVAQIFEKDGVAIRKISYVNVHKCVVVDDVESEVLENDKMTKSYSPLEMTMYSIGENGRMVNGDKYRIFYKTVGHPLKGNQVYGIVSHIEESDNSVNNFKVTDEVLASVKCFQVQEGETVKDKMNELFERSKALLGPEANKPVFYATELFYHTPLDFMFHEKRIERAYLEAMIVGESRTHKSATAKGLLATYELGAFVSLQNATKHGLIGGSQSQGGAGGYKTRLGVIPRNHKGAVILEEFSKAPSDFISSMTDIRSSNMVKIERVSGTTTAPAKVRMLSLSNAKASSNGETIPLNQYPSGVKVIFELVGTAEDINRYDFFVIKGEGEYIDPTTPVHTEAYPKEAYLNRIRWIWSRKADNVVFNERLRKFVTECAAELNQRYQTHIQFFGREAWKKLSRIAIAVAACVCSYDETGENLKVTEEHVVWAKNYMIACYDNDLFRLSRYVSEERELSQCDTTDVQVLQGLYNQNDIIISHIDRGTEFSHAQLRAVSGMNNDDYNKLINRLTGGRFIQFSGDKIRPTQKFRKAISRVETNKMKRV